MAHDSGIDDETRCGGHPNEDGVTSDGDTEGFGPFSDYGYSNPIPLYDLWRLNDDPNPDDIGTWIGGGFSTRESAVVYAITTGIGVYSIAGRNEDWDFMVKADGTVEALPETEDKS